MTASAPASWPPSPATTPARPPASAWGIALGYGMAAGAIAALVLWLMGRVQQALWSGPQADSAGYTVAVIMAGGVLLAVLHHARSGAPALQDEPAHPTHPARPTRRSTLLLALSAVVAVGFGGAVGPEAGLLAVVAECSAIVAWALARNQAQRQLIQDTGAVAALSGLYAAPPGAAMLLDEGSAAAQPAATPLPLKLLAGVSGLGGFMLLGHWLLPQGLQQLPLPAHTPSGNGSDMVLALPSAVAGALLGGVLVWLRGQLPRWLSLAGGRTRQILLGSAVFAGLAALFPLLRFSGHHELEHALQHGIHAGGWALLALALGKVLALALCLASGWKGGEFFPALFAGAALAAAVHLLLPGIGLTVAIMGSAGAIATVVLGKPLAVLLIVLLLAGSAAPGALFSGVLVGYFFRQYLLPRAWLAHAGAGHGHAP